MLDSIYSSGKVGPCIWLYPLFFYLWHLLTLSSCTEKLGRMSVKFLSVCWYPTSLSFNIFFGFSKEGMIIFDNIKPNTLMQVVMFDVSLKVCWRHESYQSVFYLEPIWRLMVDIKRFNFHFILPICQIKAMKQNWKIFLTVFG